MKIMIILFNIKRFLAFLAITGIAFNMNAASAAKLRQQIFVQGADITFNDLFEDAGAAGKIIFGAAPAPGERAIFSIPQVYSASKNAGIDWQPQPQLRSITVERVGRTIQRSAMQLAVARALNLDDADGRSVQFSSNPVLLVPLDGKVNLSLDEAEFDRIGQRFSGTLIAQADTQTPQKMRVSGRIESMADVPVLRTAMTPGQTITREDLEWVSMPLARINNGTINNADELIGFAAKRALPPGRPVRAGEVQRPILIAKGALVSLSLNTPYMRLATVGRAIESGGHGDAISVMNMQSKKTIIGTVTGLNQVEVSMDRQISALN